MVTHGSVERSALSEAEVLAAHVLRSADTKSEGVPDLPDGGVGLAAELERVLGAVRAAFPEMEEVTVRAPWEPGALILELEPALFESVSSALAAPGASAPLCTAEKDFDALNAAVGFGRLSVDLERRALASGAREPQHVAVVGFADEVGLPALVAARVVGAQRGALGGGEDDGEAKWRPRPARSR